MAGDKPSRGDRRIALVAVIVTGVVGVAGATLSYRAQHDSTETQRKQSELESFREVLDDALDHLGELRSAAFELRQAFRDAPGNKRRERTRARMAKAYQAARADGERIKIRLGRSGVHQVYWFATEEYWGVRRCVLDHADRTATGTEFKQEKKLLDKARADADRVAVLAYDYVRSELPENSGGPTEALSREAKARGALVKSGGQAKWSCARIRDGDA